MNYVLSEAFVFNKQGECRSVQNLWIKDGVIAYIGSKMPGKEQDDEGESPGEFWHIIDCKGKYLTTEIFDMHVHCFPRRTELGLPADEVGIKSLVGSVVDAGSSGSDSFDFFKDEVIDASKTDVYSFVNYSKVGLTGNVGELSKDEFIDERALESVIKKHSALIKGIKLRASLSVVGDKGFAPIYGGKKFAAGQGLPVMVHIGNKPPRIEEVLEILTGGDIVSHIFNGKDGGILDESGNVKDIVRDKHEQGVIYDIAHGSASFNFNVAERAISSGLIPDTISTDLHTRNYRTKISGLDEIMTKLLVSGMKIVDILRAVSCNPARVLGVPRSITVGARAALSIVALEDVENLLLVDSDGNQRYTNKVFKILGLIKDGVYMQRKSYGLSDTLIVSVIAKRSAEWTNITDEDKEKIFVFSKEVLDYALGKDIPFDNDAGITFVSHLTTLYSRLFLREDTIEISDELFKEIGDDLVAMSKDISAIAKRHFGKDIDRSEVFLVSTHLGAMRARLADKKSKEERTK